MTCQPSGAGIGVRAAHYSAVLANPASAGWCEVHSENFFAEGGQALRVLDTLAAEVALSFHGVGLSLGSAHGLDERHLQHLERLVARYQPALVSEHLSWSAVPGWHSNDLLPLPYHDEAIAVLVRHLDQLQTRLGRTVLVENVSCYLRPPGDCMPEAEFVAEVCRRSGCGLLLDVNNVYVNAANTGLDPVAYLHTLPARGLVQEIHLAGHTVTVDGLVDTHANPVCEPVWQLYEAALARFGAVPTLVEWDHDLPPYARLLDEAARANRLLAAQLDAPCS